MELIGWLFLAVILMIAAVAFIAVAGVLCLFGALIGMVYGRLALKEVRELADTAVTAIDRRTKTPQRLAVIVWRETLRAWQFACRVRRTTQRVIRFATGPIDRRLQTRPRTQWSARFAGRWSFRFALLASPFVAYISIYIYSSRGNKPDLAVITGWQPPVIGHLYDRNGAVVMRAFNEARVLISAREFANPRYNTVRNALIAAEDKRFWDHDGVDWRATMQETVKTAYKKLRGQDGRGASSITQQVARNIYPALQEIVAKQKSGTLTVDNVFTRSLSTFTGTTWTNKVTRKLPEIRTAVWTEEGLTGTTGSKKSAKELILATYANFVNLGDGVYGVEYAARHSFCKGADGLEPHEAAYLASLIPAPNVYRKARTPAEIEAATSRRNHVLKRMAENSFITWKQFEEDRLRPLGFCPVPQGPKTEAPAAVKVALREMRTIEVENPLTKTTEKPFTSERLHNGDFELGLTIDMQVQRTVNRAAYRHIYGDPADKLPGFAGKYPKAKTPQLAIVVMRPTGEVLAMHGGFVPADVFYSYTANNRATEAWPPTGSAFKAVDIAAAVAAGVHPDDIVYDQRVCIRKNLAGDLHCFDNYKNEYQGAVSFREASAQSLNGAFMWTMLNRAGGHKAAIAWARELGITSRLEPYPPTILGSNGVRPIELAKVFARLGSGLKAEPFIVQSIAARDGSVLYNRKVRVTRLNIPGTDTPFPPEQLIEAQQLLRGNVRLLKGTARSLNDSAKFPIEVACKTGTANQHRAALLGCFTYGPEGIAVVAWAGYDDYSPLPNEGLHILMKATGGSVLGQMVREIFLGVYGNGKPLGMPPSMPDEIELPIDAYLAGPIPAPEK